MELSREEQEVAAELERVLESPGADAAYDAVPGAAGGKVLNADLARELSPRYQTAAQRIAYTRATYPPCSRYVLDRFVRTVQQSKGLGRRKRWFGRFRGREAPQVVFLAGGAASGKSTAIGRTVVEAASLVFDSNLAQFEKASGMIHTAIAWGWAVQVVYLHRNFAFAVDNMLRRALKHGRYIPVRSSDGQDLASLHFNSQRTAVRLARHFAHHGGVTFIPLENPWTPENGLPVEPLGDMSVLAEGGKLHYNSVEDLYALQNPILDRFRVEETIPAELMAVLGLAPA